ncbi:hypothetical protein pSalSNUABM01_118 [Salmonella phage pSal-SNUABM-01]|nr:hypothetical protein pSalSNUABM01_118 [Salmonella phage pSal-SNUABM-01]
MRVNKAKTPAQLTFEDLNAGDVFSCQGPEGVSNPDVMIKVETQQLRSGFKVQAVALESAKMYGNFKDNMPVRYFPKAAVDLGE